MIALGQATISKAGHSINLPALLIVALAHGMLMTEAISPFAKVGGPSSLAPPSLQVVLLSPVTAPQLQALQPFSVTAPLPIATEEVVPASTQAEPIAPPSLEAGMPLYYPASVLSRMPEIEGLFEVQLPPGLNLNGQVELRLWIDAAGKLDRIQTISSELPAPYQQAAIAAFQRMHYRPGQIDGQPVAAFVDIVVEMNASPVGPALH